MSTDLTTAPEETQSLPDFLQPPNPTAGLTGTQRVALLLLQMDEEASTAVLKEFTPAEVQDISSEMLLMDGASRAQHEAVLTEFYELAISGQPHRPGGRDTTLALLTAAFGEDAATEHMDALDSRMSGESFDFLMDIDPGRIYSLLEGELPETIALVLSHLGAAKATAVLNAMPEDARVNIGQAIATESHASPDAVAILVDSLKGRIGGVRTHRRAPEVIGGVDPLVSIINRAGTATERLILEGLAERDPELAEQVRAKLLTFADIVKFEPRDVQQILRLVEVRTLALALRSAKQDVHNTVMENLTQNKQEDLTGEMETLGARVPRTDVEEARGEIVALIRELESEGKITVRRAGEDEFV